MTTGNSPTETQPAGTKSKAMQRTPSLQKGKLWFDQQLQQHRRQLMNVALHLTHGNGADAEDLVQDTLLRACERFETFRTETSESVLPWLCTILRNLYFNQRRREKAHQRHSGNRLSWDDLYDSALKETIPVVNPPRLHSAEATAMQNFTRHSVLTALQQLPPLYRETLALISLEGLSYEEVAERIGVPVGTVRSRLHRGRAFLARAVLL